ncbi:MAG TPA: YceD family protein [Microbacteriaceae bacterium]|nr:YceD family protein [Microbacteriaceae bacterium]
MPTLDGLGEGLARVAAGTVIRTEVTLESLHDGILVSAAVEARAVGECSRCLKEIELPVEVDIQELFAYSSDEAYEYEVRGGEIDCGPLVHDTVVLALPFQPVCRPECPGLDPATGMLRTSHADAEPARHDPRWAALAGLRVVNESGADEPARDEE